MIHTSNGVGGSLLHGLWIGLCALFFFQVADERSKKTDLMHKLKGVRRARDQIISSLRLRNSQMQAELAVTQVLVATVIVLSVSCRRPQPYLRRQPVCGSRLDPQF